MNVFVRTHLPSHTEYVRVSLWYLFQWISFKWNTLSKFSCTSENLTDSDIYIYSDDIKIVRPLTPEIQKEFNTWNSVIDMHLGIVQKRKKCSSSNKNLIKNNACTKNMGDIIKGKDLQV